GNGVYAANIIAQDLTRVVNLKGVCEDTCAMPADRLFQIDRQPRFKQTLVDHASFYAAVDIRKTVICVVEDSRNAISRKFFPGAERIAMIRQAARDRGSCYAVSVRARIVRNRRQYRQTNRDKRKAGGPSTSTLVHEPTVREKNN
ncbi:MAG: hypothetical protein J0I81_01220, partial [Hyphomicrobium sp.]|nr:hypothetical protein [Hyphomicrobium sp.]